MQPDQGQSTHTHVLVIGFSLAGARRGDEPTPIRPTQVDHPKVTEGRDGSFRSRSTPG